MLTRRCLLQAAAALVTGSAVAPKLIAADPVATEYGRLGRARYIFPLEFPNQSRVVRRFETVFDDVVTSLEIDPTMDIRTLLHASAAISVVQLDYDIHYWHQGREQRWPWSKNYEGGFEFNLVSSDSLEITFPVRNEFVPPEDWLPSTLTVHGITTKQAAPTALRLG